MDLDGGNGYQEIGTVIPSSSQVFPPKTHGLDLEYSTLLKQEVSGKKANVMDTPFAIVGKTGLIGNYITLRANVRGSDVVTKFTVIGAYHKEKSRWKPTALTSSSIGDHHQL
ncbi:MAG: hypothetical protein ACK4LB_13050 [Spirosomataceae bacterium]